MTLVAVVLAASVAAHAGALPTPEAADSTYLASCREYQKARAHKPADLVLAEACRAYAQGYIQGWENRQNTPMDVLPNKACANNLDRFIDRYVADEKDGGSPMPPNVALMGNLVLNFPCK